VIPTSRGGGGWTRDLLFGRRDDRAQTAFSECVTTGAWRRWVLMLLKTADMLLLPQENRSELGEAREQCRSHEKSCFVNSRI
jgi:hypothetical protein